MYIAEVTGRNVKGWKGGTIDLGLVSVITGRNFTGKTAVLDTIRLAIFGNDPRLGGRPGDPFKLASDSPMECAVKFSGRAESARRVWTQTKRGSIEVKEEVSEGVVFPPVMLDLNLYLGLTGPQRTAFVFDRVRDTGLDNERIAKAITETPVEIQGEHAQTARTELVGDWDDIRSNAEEAGIPVPEAVTQLLDRMRTQLAEARREETRARGALQQMVSAQMAGGFTSADPDAEAKLQAATKAKAEVAGKVQELLRRLKESRAGAQRLLEARDALVKAQTAYGLDAEVRHGELRTLQAELLGKPVTAGAAVNAAAEKVMALDRKLAGLRADRDAVRREIERLERSKEEADGKPCCPTCGTKGKAWHEAFRRKVDDELMPWVRKVPNMDALVAAVETERANASNEWNVLKGKADEERKVAERLHSVMQEIRRLDEYAGNLRTAQATLTAVEASAIPDEPDVDEVTLAQSQADALEQSIVKWQDAVRRLAAQRRDNDRQVRAQDDADRWAAKVAVIAECGKAIKAIREEAVEKVLGGFTGDLARFTQGIIPGEPCFRDGELGLLRGSRWISHVLLSGTEQLIVHAALCVVLASKSPFKLVVMDELGRLDDASAKAVIERMGELVVAEFIDQFIGVDVNAERYHGTKATLVPIH